MERLATSKLQIWALQGDKSLLHSMAIWQWQCHCQWQIWQWQWQHYMLLQAVGEERKSRQPCGDGGIPSTWGHQWGGVWVQVRQGAMVLRFFKSAKSLSSLSSPSCSLLAPSPPSSSSPSWSGQRYGVLAAWSMRCCLGSLPSFQMINRHCFF